MAYKEYFDQMAYQPYMPITEGQYLSPKPVDPRPIESPTKIDYYEYEQFKKYLEFKKEKEILEKYEREGLITIRRREPETIVVKEKEPSDATVGIILLGIVLTTIKVIVWLL